MTTLSRAADEALVRFDRERREAGLAKWNLEDLLAECEGDLASGLEAKTIVHTPLDQARTALRSARSARTTKGREFLRNLVCDRNVGPTVPDFYDRIVALGGNDTVNLMAITPDDFALLDVAENENAAKAVSRCKTWNANKAYVIEQIELFGTLGKAIEQGAFQSWGTAA